MLMKVVGNIHVLSRGSRNMYWLSRETKEEKSATRTKQKRKETSSGLGLGTLSKLPQLLVSLAHNYPGIQL
jgi:hypothetical protein